MGPQLVEAGDDFFCFSRGESTSPRVPDRVGAACSDAEEATGAAPGGSIDLPRPSVMVVPDYASRVGCRVQTNDGARATVRYVGAVDGQEGEWVGVEWDDPGRGKHDGSHGGKRYFECVASSENAGSFVRTHKIRPSVTFSQAIQSKYLDGKSVNVASRAGAGAGTSERTNANEPEPGPDGKEGAAGGEEEGAGLYVQSSNGQKIEIELCLKKDDDPVKALTALDRIYLPDAAIHTAGVPGEASSCGVVASKLKILDLAGNLLADWPAVARFGEEFPNLVNLDLSHIRAAWPTSPPASPSPFANLSVLVMNRSGVTWQQAACLIGTLPSLTELSVAGCGIDRLGEGEGLVDGSAPGFAALKALNLEDNHISDWAQVERLAFLPALERLLMGGNKLPRVAYPFHLIPEGAATRPFACLNALLLANNAVDGWDSVDALNDFPQLAEVRLTGNPVTASAATRHEIVARVARLSSLNGSLIADQERKDAEIRYLRRVLGLVKGAEAAGGSGPDGAPGTDRAPQSGSEAVAALHPRMQALIGSYGELSTHVTRGPGTGKMGEDMLSLTLTCVAASAGEKAPQTKKVPMTLTVGKLKLLCEKLFKVKADAQQLYYKEPYMAMPELLEPDDYDISYLGVRDGASILVEDK